MIIINTDINNLKGGLREYINILYAINSINNDIDNINTLKELSNKIEDINNIKELETVKEDIINIENNTKTNQNNISNSYKENLTQRELNLIKRGYSKEKVSLLCNYTEENIHNITNIIINNSINNCKRIKNPTCYFIGGQPGCGKSTSLLKLKNSFSNDGVIEIGIDNYRAYHPNYSLIEEEINNHWINRNENENDSPGNDIADFTNDFAGKISDNVIKELLNESNNYNLIIEWGMRTPNEPLELMKKLKELNYNVIVYFVLVNKELSYKASILRADSMKDMKHIIRKIPKSFHELCIEELPDSCETIFKEGFVNNKYIDNFTLITRDGEILWNNSNTNPKSIYKEYLNKKI